MIQRNGCEKMVTIEDNPGAFRVGSISSSKAIICVYYIFNIARYLRFSVTRVGRLRTADYSVPNIYFDRPRRSHEVFMLFGCQYWESLHA